jgi:arylsulfatase A-like enzyme
MPPSRIPLAFAALFLVSCAPRNDGPNVVLITVDTLRPDHLGGWGYPRGTSPALDRLVAEGTAFVTTLAPRGQTWPTLASIHTSLYPVDHGLRKNGQPLPAGLPTLAGVLRAEGWDCAASITNAGQVDWPGFEILFREKTEDEGAHAAALEWLAGRDRRPFFLWIHYFAPHKPFQPPQPYVDLFDPGYDGTISGSIAEMQRITARGTELPARDLAHVVARYDGEIRRFDGMLDDLLRTLRELGLAEETLVALTSDHGEELYERNRYFHHSASIYDTVLKVPLVFRWPGTVPAGRWVPGLTESMDLAPTILDLIGIESPDAFRGTSLADAITRKAPVRDRIAFAEIEDMVVSARTNEFRYVHNPTDFDVPLGKDDYRAVYPIAREELYAHDRDPAEQVNAAASRPDDAAALRARVESWQREHDWEERSRAHRRRGVPEDVRASLEALGYVP